MTEEEVFEPTPDADILDERQRFEDEQLTGLGATDSPKILGLSKYGTALSVYRRLTGEAPPYRPSLPAWLGLKLEATVAEIYTTSTGNRVRTDARHHRHPTYDFIVCHLDRRIWGDPKTLVELKTRSRFTGWGADGSRDVPVEVYVQCQHEMLVTGAHTCHVAVLFGLGQGYRTYVLPREDDFLTQLVPALQEFWEEHFLPRIPPEPTGAPADTEDVSAHAPSETNGILMPATPELEALVDRLRLARQNEAQARLTHQEIKNRLKLQIGEYDGLIGRFGRIYYRRTKPHEEIHYDLIAAAYRHLIDQLLPSVDKRVREKLHVREHLATIPGLYTQTIEGHPRFTAYLEDT